MVAVVGIPFDAYSSFLQGSALAPARIREIWSAGACNLCSESGIDLDVLDPAFAPGVSHHEPGGMSTRQVIELIQQLGVPIVGADIVEFNPKRDPSEITAMVAVKILKEVASRMIELPIELTEN